MVTRVTVARRRRQSRVVRRQGGVAMWEAVQRRFPVGSVVRGTVTAHHPFGVFVDLGDPVALGLVQVTEFLDGGRMTPEQYPAVGEAVTAVVLGHTDERRKQVWLCVRPRVLQRHDPSDVQSSQEW